MYNIQQDEIQYISWNEFTIFNLTNNFQKEDLSSLIYTSANGSLQIPTWVRSKILIEISF